ncbi:hypothetical protein BJV78DRAFT_1176571 [Lactifluus subvellereus]|nr:hypothetical protein BJV78DRAFT_1176571 [Lactifluus subvellereus]
MAWNSSFRDNTADVLLTTISDYPNGDIVNSSGTGKSRTVDEVAREILTVPMCLREDGSQGFPPPDVALRGWLTSATDPNDQFAVAQRLHGFVYSLLTVTFNYLVVIESERHDIPTLPTLTDDDLKNLSQAERSEQARLVKTRQGKLAVAFHECMTAGQSFETPKSYRRTFFKEVIDGATEFARDTVQVPGLREQSLPGYQHRGERVTKAGIKLSRFVDPKGLLDSPKGPRHPLVILAFDESHILTDTPRGKSWTIFSELHRVLGRLVHLPIFTLFLTTAGKFHLSSPEIRSDPSRRVANRDLPLLHPVSEISFDDLAYPAMEDDIALSQVVQMDWIFHLGRPLFGSHYDALQKNRSEDEIMLFAKQKLLDGKSSLADVNGPGTLACLSVRFALESNLADGDARIVARRQIERHMRLCVAATTGFETLVTVAGSEPLLAEAACELMGGTEANPVRHLRGELVAALLVMRARDESSVTNKWVFVIDFMKALLPAPAYEILKDARPSHWRPGESKPFEETFSGYAMWFNHVIRIRDYDMINIRSLWKFITRGAMVMCANNQRGIDIVLPICNTSRKLSRHNVTAILIQVKNDKAFQHQIDKMLFDGMDPFRIGLFSNGDFPLPVIRMVFALASNQPGVLFPAVPERRNHVGRFTAYDIWCPGLSPETFKDIGGDLTSYQTLLQRSLQPHDVYDLKETKDQYLDEATRSARGSLRRRMEPLADTRDEHNYSHTETVPPA